MTDPRTQEAALNIPAAARHLVPAGTRVIDGAKAMSRAEQLGLVKMIVGAVTKDSALTAAQKMELMGKALELQSSPKTSLVSAMDVLSTFPRDVRKEVKRGIASWGVNTFGPDVKFNLGGDIRGAFTRPLPGGQRAPAGIFDGPMEHLDIDPTKLSDPMKILSGVK
jgi:hypothetical protein